MSLIDGQAKAQAGCTLGGCFAFTVFVIFCVALTVGFMGGPSSTDDQANANTSNSVAASCGQKSTPPQHTGTADCGGGGITSTKKSPSGYYHLTTFGCSGDGKYIDNSDKCDATCGTSVPFLKEILTVNGVKKLPQSCKKYLSDGKTFNQNNYENAVGYFSANWQQYGSGANVRLKVTNPKTGQAVVVKPVDGGPNCKVQNHEYTLDMSRVAANAIRFPDIVKVEVVPGTTPIGPVKCTASSFTSRIACALGVEGSLPAVDSIFEGISNLSANS